MTDPEALLRDVFATHADRVLAYASRHTDAHSAQDVVGEVFLVAWRRVSELPAEPLPWLLVVARNTLANRARSLGRRQRLDDAVHLQAALATSPTAEETVVERRTMLAALATLTPHEREALLLVAWDGLTAAAAAAVAGCSKHAFEVRLHRARSRLERQLAEPPATLHLVPRETQEIS